MFVNPVHCLPAFLCTCALWTATAASLHAETAYSTPCGYIQTELYAKTTGYLGLGVHPEALMQHTLQEENVTFAGTKVIIKDPDVNFQNLMDQKFAYILVLHFGDEALALPLNRDGWKNPGSCWEEHKITVDDSLLLKLVKEGSKPDSYILRKARTLDDVLGSDNQFGLKDGSAMSADTVNIFNSATTQLAVYYSGSGWRRRGSTDNIGAMPVFSHEPLTIARKADGDVTAVVIGEVSMKHQKLVMPKSNSLLHTRLPLAQTLAETALDLPDGAIVNIPIGEKNAMVKVVRQKGAWVREDKKGNDVSNTPFHGAFSVYDTSSKTPVHITVSSKHLTNH